MTALPDKPSALLRLALADLRKVEALPEIYTVDMGTYHESWDGRCNVCLAGAVMAGTLNIPADEDTLPCNLGIVFAPKLHALDALRAGEVGGALARLLLDKAVSYGLPNSVDIFPYSTANPEPFHADLNQLATMLEAAGL